MLHWNSRLRVSMKPSNKHADQTTSLPAVMTRYDFNKQRWRLPCLRLSPRWPRSRTRAGLPGATADQRPTDGAIFEAEAIEHQATVTARLDLMRTSCKIAWQYFRVTIMVCQASAVVQQKLTLTSSYLLSEPLSRRFGAFSGIVAITLLVLLLHLFNVLCVRRVWTRESLTERVAASAALFVIFEEFLETSLDWMFNLQSYATLVTMCGSASG